MYIDLYDEIHNERVIEEIKGEIKIHDITNGFLQKAIAMNEELSFYKYEEEYSKEINLHNLLFTYLGIISEAKSNTISFIDVDEDWKNIKAKEDLDKDELENKICIYVEFNNKIYMTNQKAYLFSEKGKIRDLWY